MLSSSSSAAIRYILESNYGVTPVAGNPNNLRFTGESLAFSIQTTESGEIVDDRQTSDLVIVGAGADGGINFELIYREFDKFLEAAFMGTYSEFGTAGVGDVFDPIFTAPAAGDGGTVGAAVAPVGNSAFTNLQRGQWFRLGAVGSANDGKFLRVHSTIAPTANLITLDESTPVSVSDVAAATIATSRLTNGATERYFSIERALGDVGQFFVYRGMALNKMSLKFASGSITSGSFEFIGKNGERQTATFLPGVPVASVAHTPQNGVSGISAILEGGAPLEGTFVKNLDLTIENNLRGRDGLGTLGNVSVGVGSLKVTGTMEVYLADGTLYDKFINNDDSSLQVVSMDTSKNGYAIQIPRLKYSDAKVNAGGKDQDIMLSLPFQGIKDPVTGKTIFLDRIGA